MVLKFFLLWGMIILGIFYIITYPYKSKLARKLKRVNSFEEIEFIKNSDESYSNISQVEIDEYVTLEERNIKSSFVDEEMKYTIITPKDNIKDGIPCLFLLHGLRDENKDWMEKGKLLENYLSLLKKGDIEPMIFILAGSGEEGQSWYSNFSAEKGYQYENYIISELIPEIKRKVPKSPLGIVGFSMGGYAAFKLGLKYIDIFKVIGSFSGAINLVRMSVNRRVIRLFKFMYIPKFLFNDVDKRQFIRVFGSWGYKILKEDPYSMIKYMEAEKLSNKYFYASVGIEDRVNHLMLQQWLDVMGRMKKNKYNFKGYLCDGETHTWDYVARDMTNFLKFFNEKINK
ncbi:MULTISPECIES: alpha/beta hydrolase family protein [Fusobacterium]|uniref:alpha/beta hydrolase n=1 Tax=Fusobacterium TaxID=848 RepID=UPI0025D7B584|nr:alpha/beta hydrolase-fold protein [Fusobacterium ulcerans]